MAYTRTTWSTGDLITAAKLNNFEADIQAVSDGTNARGTQRLLGTHTLGSDAARLTLSSGIAGNTDKVIYIVARFKFKRDAAEVSYLQLVLNNDTTFTNYASVVSRNGITGGAVDTAYNSDSVIFEKLTSGSTAIGDYLVTILIQAEVAIAQADRLAIVTTAYNNDISSVTRGNATILWNNNADELTRIDLRATNVSGETNAILSGSSMDVYKLLRVAS